MYEVGHPLPLQIFEVPNLFSPSTRGRIVDLATNCYGCHVLQKALDCEEDIRLLIVSELLLGDPAQTLVNKHASHVWSKVGCDFYTGVLTNHRHSDHGVDLDSSSPSHIRLVSPSTCLLFHYRIYTSHIL
jgi:hypothetical protein